VVRTARPEAALAPPQRRGPSSLLRPARRFFAESLFKNSAFLILDLGLGTLTGYGSLTLITRIYPVQDVGLTATAVSAIALVTYITQFGINYSVPRYLPTAKNRTTMINTVLTVVVGSTLIAAVIFLTLPYARKLWALGGVTFGVAFVASACVQAGVMVLTTVLVADRAAGKLVTIGSIPSVAQLAAPPAFSFLGAFGAFLARVSGNFFSFITFSWLLVKRGHRFRPEINIAETRELIKFSAGMYVANLVGGVPQLLLPLVVLAKVGASQAAYWSISMSVAAILFSLPGQVTAALLPEVSSRPVERRALLRRSTYLITAMVLPALIIAFVFAPIPLAIFGHSYSSQALAPLRWLIVAGFVTMLNYVTGAILIIAKKSMMVTIVNLVDAVVVLGLVTLWATNVTQIAIAWTIGDVGNTLLFGFFAFLAVREVGGRLEYLGDRPAGASAATLADPSATSQLRALDALATMAEQQNAADTYRPYYPSMTATTGLFSIAAFRAAEQQRQESMKGAEPARETRPPSVVRPPSEDRQHRQAFELLFKMAEAQRTEPGGEGNGNIPSDLRR
jgi:O-antigen/teichoic acid export membrane protein